MSKEYTLIGGNGTVVSPLEVTEDGDYVAGDSRAFNPVKVRTGGGGSSTLSGLTDVDLTNPTDGQTLVYDASSSKWVNGSGGGGLPTPTAADVGAGLTVQATPVPGAVVVPEQTAAWSDDVGGFLLTNVNAELFVAGARVFATIGDESAIATVEEDEDFISVGWNTENVGYSIDYNKYNEVFSAFTELDPPPETITVSCNLAVDSYAWAVDPYAGYDVVVMLDAQISSQSLTDAGLHLVKGSYADCVAIMASKKPISALVYYSYAADTYVNATYPSVVHGYWNYGDYVWLIVNDGRSTTKSIYLTESGLTLVAPG